MPGRGSNQCQVCGKYANRTHRCAPTVPSNNDTPALPVLPRDTAVKVTIGSPSAVDTVYSAYLALDGVSPTDAPFAEKNPETESNTDNITQEQVSSLKEMLNQGNLPMFMTAREILENFQGRDRERRNTWEQDPVLGDQQFFTRKRTEAYDRDPSGLWQIDGTQRESMSESIKKSGVAFPIMLEPDLAKTGMFGRREVINGHHRLGVLIQYLPDVPIPIMFFSDPEEALLYGDTTQIDPSTR